MQLRTKVYIYYFQGSPKNSTFRGGHEKSIQRGGLPKKGKEGGGSVFEKGLISQCTLCTMEIFSVVKVKGCLLKMKKEQILLGYCRKKYHFFCVTNPMLLDAGVTLSCLFETFLVSNQLEYKKVVSTCCDFYWFTLLF